MSVLERVLQAHTMRLVLDGGRAIEIVGPADITKEKTDAIVNAANSSLLGGGGVDGAIHRAGGPAIVEECRRIAGSIGRLPAGQAVITTGGRLAAKHVIHTVGPIYSGKPVDSETLASCHSECVRIADENALRSVAFPAISTGAFGYPIAEAAPVAISSTVAALATARNVATCRFVLFDVAAVRAFERAAEKLIQTNTSLRIEKALS